MRRHARTGKYIAIRDAERELGIPYHRLYRWVRSGQLPCLSSDVTGCSIYIERASLDRFLAENTTEVRA